jgi:hypothetical protein
VGGRNVIERSLLAAVQSSKVQEFKVNFHLTVLKSTLSRKRSLFQESDLRN